MLDSVDNSWSLAWKDQKAFYGKHRHPPGGPDLGVPDATVDKRMDETPQVVAASKPPETLVSYERCANIHVVRELFANCRRL